MSFAPEKGVSSILNSAMRVSLTKLKNLTDTQKSAYINSLRRAKTKEDKDRVLRNARAASKRAAENSKFKNAKSNAFKLNSNKFENAKNNAFEINKNVLNKIKQDFNNSVNVNMSINRNQSVKLKPELVQALTTNNSANNKRIVDLSVKRAKEKYPNVNWDVVIREEIRPFADKIRDQITTGNVMKAISSVATLYATYYMYQKDPVYMTRLTNNGMRKLSEVVPFLTPISDRKSPKWKRMISLVAMSAAPSAEQLKQETMFATLPANKYGRSSIGILTQYLSILMTSILSVVPWDKGGMSSKFVFVVLQLTQKLAGEVFNNLITTSIQRTSTTSGIGWRVFANAITSVGTLSLSPIGAMIAR